MSDMIPFDFEDALVRVIDQGGEPWFILSDACKVLEITKHRDAAGRLDADERGSVVVDTLGGPQETITISESGLYALIFRSRKPQAVRFRKWVTSQVLPTIRKTGKYAVGREQAPERGLNEQRLTNELVTLQQKHIKALNDLEELRRVHEQWIARNRHWFTIERLIKEGFDTQTIATLAETTTAYVEHIRISVKKMQDAEQAPA